MIWRRWTLSGVLTILAVLEGGWLLHRNPLMALIVMVALILAAIACSPSVFPRDTSPVDARVTVYWRPGCQYCLRLRWGLGRRARHARWIDIWSDEEARAYVRSVNAGNETVPTVVVEGQVRTNPDVAWVRRALDTAG